MFWQRDLLALVAVFAAPVGAGLSAAIANGARVEGAKILSTREIVIIALLASAVVALSVDAMTAFRNLTLAMMIAYLAAFDLRSYSIPVWPCVGATLLGLLVAATEGQALERLCATLVGFFVFRALDIVYRRLRGSGALGAGDALVAGLIASWTGFIGLAWSVTLGSIVSIIWVVASARPSSAPLPFVPGLACGLGIYLIFESLFGWL